ncbi:uncharacterized protein LOC124896714 [Capsicum annuum]|uniref:uncharacterized protein LOC124896714 n=1 Tax=Capsicum annuum TaxID=4072 RepID=UPI001FB0DFBB|nr:uncharacterized protein LOC124896714 [Capsicum annuum]
MVNVGYINWAKKLDEVLWSYRMDYKTLIGMSPYQLVFGKAYQLLVELKHKALLELKRLNMNWGEASKARVTQLYEMEEFPLKAYENSALSKEKMQKWDDARILTREFHIGENQRDHGYVDAIVELGAYTAYYL